MHEELKNKLVELKFSQRDIDRILKRRNCKAIVRELSVAEFDQELTSSDLAKVSCYQSGDRNLAALSEYYNLLRALGFSKEQIVRVARFHTGYAHLKVVYQKSPELLALGFTEDDIVNIVAHCHGERNILCVLDSYIILTRNIALDNKQIVSIVNYNYGFKAIEALVSDYGSIFSLGFTSEQIVQMLVFNPDGTNRKSYNNIKILVEHLGTIQDRLLLIPFFADDIIKALPEWHNNSNSFLLLLERLSLDEHDLNDLDDLLVEAESLPPHPLTFISPLIFSTTTTITTSAPSEPSELMVSFATADFRLL